MSKISNLLIALIVGLLAISCGGGGGGGSGETSVTSDTSKYKISHPWFVTLENGTVLENGSASYENISGVDSIKLPIDGGVSVNFTQSGENSEIRLLRYTFPNIITHTYSTPYTYLPASSEISVGYTYIRDQTDGGVLSESGSLIGGIFTPGFPREEVQILSTTGTNPANGVTNYLILRTSSDGDWDGIESHFPYGVTSSELDVDFDLSSITYPYTL